MYVCIRLLYTSSIVTLLFMFHNTRFVPFSNKLRSVLLKDIPHKGYQDGFVICLESRSSLQAVQVKLKHTLYRHELQTYIVIPSIFRILVP